MLGNDIIERINNGERILCCLHNEDTCSLLFAYPIKVSDTKYKLDTNSSDVFYLNMSITKTTNEHIIRSLETNQFYIHGLDSNATTNIYLIETEEDKLFYRLKCCTNG